MSTEHLFTSTTNPRTLIRLLSIPILFGNAAFLSIFLVDLVAHTIDRHVVGCGWFWFSNVGEMMLVVLNYLNDDWDGGDEVRRMVRFG